MITKFSHPVLYVNDQDEALAFYRDKLGFAVHSDSQYGEMRWLTIQPPENAHEELVIFKATTPASLALVGKQSPECPFLAFVTTNCEVDCQLFKERGVRIIEKPTVQPWGIQALFLDLYGNLITLIQYV